MIGRVVVVVVIMCTVVQSVPMASLFDAPLYHHVTECMKDIATTLKYVVIVVVVRVM